MSSDFVLSSHHSPPNESNWKQCTRPLQASALKSFTELLASLPHAEVHLQRSIRLPSVLSSSSLSDACPSSKETPLGFIESDTDH